MATKTKLVEVARKDLQPGQTYTLRILMGDKKVPTDFLVSYLGKALDGPQVMLPSGDTYAVPSDRGVFLKKVEVA